MTKQTPEDLFDLKFHLWLGCHPIYDTETKELTGYHMPEHVKDFCAEIRASGENPLQRYKRIHNHA